MIDRSGILQQQQQQQQIEVDLRCQESIQYMFDDREWWQCRRAESGLSADGGDVVLKGGCMFLGG
jgi:hypothetical protein